MKIRVILSIVLLASHAEAQGPPALAPANAAAAPSSSLAESRYVAEDEIPSYVQKISATLAMNGRQWDPFGRSQDPAYRPAVAENGRPSEEGASEPPAAQLTLQQVVSQIQVTMISASRKTFFVGDRTFKQGDRFPLRVGGDSLINIEVVSVTPGTIIFRDILKGETATYSFGGPPAGVQRAGAPDAPATLPTENPSAPLDLHPQEVPPPSR